VTGRHLSPAFAADSLVEQIKPEQIGARRRIQDPHDAFHESEGRYADPTDAMLAEQRLPMLTKAPDPNPFGNRR